MIQDSPRILSIQYCGIGGKITQRQIVFRRFRSCEAAVNIHAIMHGKGIGCRSVAIIDTCRHPNFGIEYGSNGLRLLYGRHSIGPAFARSRSGTCLRDIDNIHLRQGCKHPLFSINGSDRICSVCSDIIGGIIYQSGKHTGETTRIGRFNRIKIIKCRIRCCAPAYTTGHNGTHTIGQNRSPACCIGVRNVCHGKGSDNNRIVHLLSIVI